MAKQTTPKTEKPKEIPIHKLKPNGRPTTGTTSKVTLYNLTIGENTTPINSTRYAPQTYPSTRTTAIIIRSTN